MFQWGCLKSMLVNSIFLFTRSLKSSHNDLYHLFSLMFSSIYQCKPQLVINVVLCLQNGTFPDCRFKFYFPVSKFLFFPSFNLEHVCSLQAFTFPFHYCSGNSQNIYDVVLVEVQLNLSVVKMEILPMDYIYENITRIMPCNVSSYASVTKHSNNCFLQRCILHSSELINSNPQSLK